MLTYAIFICNKLISKPLWVARSPGLSINLSLESSARALKHTHFQGVMKIGHAVTLAVLGLLKGRRNMYKNYVVGRSFSSMAILCLIIGNLA